jgi:hypothetical protein
LPHLLTISLSNADLEATCRVCDGSGPDPLWRRGPLLRHRADPPTMLISNLLISNLLIPTLLISNFLILDAPIANRLITNRLIANQAQTLG